MCFVLYILIIDPDMNQIYTCQKFCKTLLAGLSILTISLIISIYKINMHTKSLTVRRKMDPVEVIRQDCGELCNMHRSGSPGVFFDQMSASVNCTALFRNELIDANHGQVKSPSEIPEKWRNYFTMNGKLKIYKKYLDQNVLGNKNYITMWKKNEIEGFVNLAKKEKLKGTYGLSETRALQDGIRHASGITGGRVLVIGSRRPWVEACLLADGASAIVTLEYRKIICNHPKIKTIMPHEFRERFLNGSIGLFDAVVTFSSLEHCGLGRYGDILNPWGDIIAVARAWCVTKADGSLTIGVEYDDNKDYILFNGGRRYGKIRYPYLTTNWKQLYRGMGKQRVHVFTK